MQILGPERRSLGECVKKPLLIPAELLKGAQGRSCNKIVAVRELGDCAISGDDEEVRGRLRNPCEDMVLRCCGAF